MNQKTYAFFDVIGIKHAFRQGNAAEILTKFWNEVDGWTMSGFKDVGKVRVYGQNRDQDPSPFVRTYSDSAILYNKPEIEIEDFYCLALSLKKKIDIAAGGSYTIINRDDEIVAPSRPILGGIPMGQNNKPRYENIFGSGPAFINIYLADLALKEAIKDKQLNLDFRIYCVGRQSFPRSCEVKASMTFKGHNDIACDLFAVDEKMLIASNRRSYG